jgi:hypothetical protein
MNEDKRPKGATWRTFGIPASSSERPGFGHKGSQIFWERLPRRGIECLRP